MSTLGENVVAIHNATVARAKMGIWSARSRCRPPRLVESGPQEKCLVGMLWHSRHDDGEEGGGMARPIIVHRQSNCMSAGPTAQMDNNNRVQCFYPHRRVTQCDSRWLS